MTIEPHAVTTVSIRAFPPNPPECKTPEQTIADIRARFPRCFTASGLANPAAFARMENAKAAYDNYLKGDPNSDMQKSAIRAARRRQGEITENAILEALGSREMTSADLANITGIHTNTVANAGLRLEAMGKVTRYFRRHLTIWRKVAAIQEEQA